MSHGLCHDLMHRNAGPACQRISNYTRPIFHDRAKNCSKRDRTDDIIMPVRQGAKAPSAAIDAPLSTARVQVWRHKWVVGIIRVYPAHTFSRTGVRAAASGVCGKLLFFVLPVSSGQPSCFGVKRASRGLLPSFFLTRRKRSSGGT